MLPFHRLALADNETIGPSDKWCGISNKCFCVSELREPKIPAGVPGSIVLHGQIVERVGIKNPLRDVSGAVPSNSAGSQPFELRGWMGIGLDNSPGAATKLVHGRKRLLKAQGILRLTRISRTP